LKELRPEDHKIISSKCVFSGKVVGVFIDEVSLPDGRIARWERVNHPGAVGIVPMLDDSHMLLVKQYRHATRKVLLEIPAGKLDIASESPEDCASRELVEEVGHSAATLVKLAEFYNSPGYSNEYFHLYLAKNLERASGVHDDDEFLTVELVRLENALELIERSEIVDAKSIIGITLATLYLEGRYTGLDG